jgi:hypothetical protein
MNHTADHLILSLTYIFFHQPGVETIETEKWVLLFLHHRQLLWLFSLPLAFSVSFLMLLSLKQTMQASQGTTSLMYVLITTSLSFLFLIFNFVSIVDHKFEKQKSPDAYLN